MVNIYGLFWRKQTISYNHRCDEGLDSCRYDDKTVLKVRA